MKFPKIHVIKYQEKVLLGGEKKLIGCTLPTDPNMQGRPFFFILEKNQSKRSNFLPNIVFLKISKHET